MVRRGKKERSPLFGFAYTVLGPMYREGNGRLVRAGVVFILSAEHGIIRR